MPTTHNPIEPSPSPASVERAHDLERSAVAPRPNPWKPVPLDRNSRLAKWYVHPVCVDPKCVHELWLHVAPLVKAGVLRTDLSHFDEIESDVLAGRSLLWLGWYGHIEAAVTTTLLQSNTGKVCVITAAGGRGLARWEPLLERIEAYAKAEGCDRVRLFGRKGWRRLMRQYELSHIILEKGL